MFVQESCILLGLPAVIRSHRRSDGQGILSPTTSSLQVSNFSPLTPRTEVCCRSQPLASAPPVSPTPGSSGRVVEVPSGSQVENNLKEDVGQGATCRNSLSLSCATSDFQKLRSPSRIISPCAGWTSRLSARSCKLGKPCIFGRSSCPF